MEQKYIIQKLCDHRILNYEKKQFLNIRKGRILLIITW